METLKVKVIHIITKLELGGAQQTTLYTLANLDQSHFIPVLICGPDGILLSDAYKIPKLRIHICNHLIRPVAPVHDCTALIILWRILRKERAAHKGMVIVHTHSSKAGILGRWAAFLAGIPIRIHTVHGFGITPDQPFFMRWIFTLAERLTRPITTRMIYVSRKNLEQGTHLGISEPRNSLIIRSGIDRASFSEARNDGSSVKDALQIPGESKVIGMIACFKPQKAPLDFIRMAHLVSLKLPGTHFLLVGDGVLRGSIERMIKELGIQKNVHLTGWRRDIPRLLSVMDIMALTSLWEGLPKVVVEALLMGIPVVATQTAGVDEVIRDGITGFIVPQSRPDIMATRIIEMLENPEKMRRMEKASPSLSDEFNLDKTVLIQEVLYQDLIKDTKFRNNKFLI
ncbi:MAG: glycosyltransferase family 4 protein [bacterium]